MAGLRDKIKHVVVLMLENRSFDCILGRLYPSDDTFNGVPEGWSNPWTGGSTPTVPAWNDEGAVEPGEMTIPSLVPASCLPISTPSSSGSAASITGCRRR